MEINDINFEEKMKEITKAMENEEFLKKATNEELMAYLFLVEKMKKKLEKIVKM